MVISSFNYTDSNYNSNDGSIGSIVVSGGTGTVTINITGPNSYQYTGNTPTPVLTGLEPGIYIISAQDQIGNADSVTITIAELPETILTAVITDACNCPDCDCEVNVISYVHNSSTFQYNLYDGTTIVASSGVLTTGNEVYTFSGLCTGDYSIEAIELDGQQHTYSGTGSSCPDGTLSFDQSNAQLPLAQQDPAVLASTWTRFCVSSGYMLWTTWSGTTPSGLDYQGNIDVGAGAFFETGIARDKTAVATATIAAGGAAATTLQNMQEGQNIGPDGIVGVDIVTYPESSFYFHPVLNKYIYVAYLSGGTDPAWITFDAKADTGIVNGNPSATRLLTTNTNWTEQTFETNPNQYQQYTIDDLNNVVLASTHCYDRMIVALKNSHLWNGYYSDCGFNDYTHEVTLGSTGMDNDLIGVVLSAVKDVTGQYGPINALHTLTLYFLNAGTNHGAYIKYNVGSSAYAFTDQIADYSGNVAKVLGYGPAASPFKNQDYNSQGYVRVKIVKSGSVITVETTETMGDKSGLHGDATVDVGNSNSYRPLFTIDLADDTTWDDKPAYAAGTELQKFITGGKIGYTQNSQRNTQFFDIVFQGDYESSTSSETLPGRQMLDVIQFTEPCAPCYLATNCEDSGETMLITLPADEPPLDVNLTYIFNEYPDKCWTIEVSTDCGEDSEDPILLNTGFIDANDTLGVEDDADFNWELISEAGGGPIAPQPAIVSNQTWLPSYGSIFNALWITEEVIPHLTGAGWSEYRLEFTLTAGFVPELSLDILTDQQGVIELNGFVIGETTNPVTHPQPWANVYSFTTNNPLHFLVGTNTLIVKIYNAESQLSNGFALGGTVIDTSASVTSTPVTVQQIYEDCNDCTGSCYRLIDCQGNADPIYTTSILSGDLTEHVGSIVTIVSCPDICWQLQEIECPSETFVEIEIVNIYPDCVSCLPQSIPVPFIKKNRTIKPGYDTKGCSPDYVQKISCEWSEALFQEAASRRYGIKFCCAYDFDSLDIKKELLYFTMLTDPDACETIVNECCPPCQLEGFICVDDAIACLPIEELTGDLVVPTTPIPNCQNIRMSVANPPGGTDIYQFRGTDCCGEQLVVDVSYGNPAIACVDMNEPITADPEIIWSNFEPCDCDENPPFDCHCLLLSSTDGTIGLVSGNDCNGDPFSVKVYPLPPGKLVNPNPIICVRADGDFTATSNVLVINKGDCKNGSCAQMTTPHCEMVTFTYTGIADDPPADVSGTYCDEESVFDVELNAGNPTFGPVCIVTASIVITGSGVTTTLSPGPCV